jgi:hypothetical protein
MEESQKGLAASTLGQVRMGLSVVESRSCEHDEDLREQRAVPQITFTEALEL